MTSSDYRRIAREKSGGNWSIGYLWLTPYMNAAYAAFYRDISSRPTVE